MNDFILVGCDTDSISVTDGNPWDTERRREFLVQLNTLFPKRINWEDDGIFDRVLVIAPKNYVLDGPKGRIIKGSSLKGTPKEPALREFIQEVIDALIYRRGDKIPSIYGKYVSEILNLTDISRWASKKTITEAVLNPGRTNESKVLDALAGTEYAQGDKRHFYFKTDGSLGLAEHWSASAPNHDVDKLLEKLYKTLQIFRPVYLTSAYLNYALKRNKPLLLSYAP